MDLNEASIEQVCEGVVEKMKVYGRVSITPDALEVTQGRIIRGSFMSWYWLQPHENSMNELAGWLYLGPFFTAWGARKAADHWGMKYYPGYAALSDLVKYFPYLEDLDGEGARTLVKQVSQGPQIIRKNRRRE